MLCSLNFILNRISALPYLGSTRKLRTLYRDERGTISILSVITLLMLTMLLGMILNVGEQIDDKIKLQNAADAATYSSAVVVARGMNTVAFTNHLLSETFALTAYFREGRDRHAESMVPPILDAWEKIVPQLAKSQFELIKDIQPAVKPKVAMERRLVKAFGEMTALKSRLLLPALESILGAPEDNNRTANADLGQPRAGAAASHLIPEFQRAVVLAVPASAAAISQEITRRNASSRKQAPPQCVLWNSHTVPVQSFNQTDPYQRLIPGLDPSFEGPDYALLKPWEAPIYQQRAASIRFSLADKYLLQWNFDRDFDLGPFNREHYHEGGRVSAKMSRFVNIWHGFTCGKLHHLLNVEFPTTNLPHMLRLRPAGMSQQQYLENEFTFTGAIYRAQRKPTMPGMYRTAMTGDAIAFTRASLYIPRPRYVTWPGCPRFYGVSTDRYDVSSCTETPTYDGWPGAPWDWTLHTQNWAAKIMPTSAESTVDLLQTNPQPYAQGVQLPNFRSIQVEDLKAINTH